MQRLPARVLEEEDVCRLLKHTECQRHPLRNKVIILLSFKAGLRACEISGLTWPMVLKSNGAIDTQIRVSKHIAKYGSGRPIPLHPELQRCLVKYHRIQGRPLSGPLVLSGLVTVWFRSLVSHYAPLASKAKGLMPPRYEWRLRAL